MPWKFDDSGNFEKGQDGNPIFVNDNGEERSVDYSAMTSALSKANKEAAERKATLRTQEETLKLFEGIEDIPTFLADAKKNAEAVAALGEKEKSTEDATRARVQAATAPLEKKIAELETAKAEILARFHGATIDSQFGTSKYVAEELANTAMVKELFAKHFSIDDNGQIVGKDAAGNVIYDENGIASFDSALRTLVSQSPYKDIIVKGSQANGSGAKGGTGGGIAPHGKAFKDMSKQEKLAYLNDEKNLKTAR